MLNEADHNKSLLQNNWLWSDCKLVLRRTNPNNPSQQSYQNLQAEVQLQLEEIDEPFIPTFSFSKQFNFNNQKGFYWKKGVPLPPLIVKLQESYLQILQQDEQIIMVYCQLTVAYPRRKDTHFYLQQIRTIGQKRKIFKQDGTIQFDGIIIKQSSQQKSNSKFSFLVTICASSIQQNKIILKTLISTAFHTETPRIIRTKLDKQSIITKLIHPKKFIKPLSNMLKNNNQKYSKQIIIESLKQLNKNKQSLSFQHPFYLVYHLSHILKVFYDSQSINNIQEVLKNISPKIDKMDENMQKSIGNYQLKKTKRIKKQKLNNCLKKRKKYEILIKGKIKDNQQILKKYLLITFQNQVLQYLNSQIDGQRETQDNTSFKEELENEIQKLSQWFNKTFYCYIKVDLLRKEPLKEYWKDIEKEHIFKAYQNHYQTVFHKLKSIQPDKDDKIQPQKETY